jgi:phosphopantothenoylcysteine decarboxylase/phosphopantothenate--cysteine ligase
MLSGKKILVTAGGTTEYIDEVRVMTNTSTGTTGAVIATELYKAGAEVHFVHGIHSMLPSERVKRYPVMSAREACSQMEILVRTEKIDAVVHAMAVSDFTFDRKTEVKCKSNDPEAFVEYMRQTICKNPKIISQVKLWRPETVLIGFKYEVGLTDEMLGKLAQDSINSNSCDLVIANDKKAIDRAGTHVAQFVYSQEHGANGFKNRLVQGNECIACHIVEFLNARLF